MLTLLHGTGLTCSLTFVMIPHLSLKDSSTSFSFYCLLPLSLHQTKVRELQQELADSLKKQSMSEAFLEVNTHYRNDLEEEKTRLCKDLERLRGKVPVVQSCAEQEQEMKLRINLNPF